MSWPRAGGATHNDCSSGKVAYTRRRVAARTARRIRDGRHMRPYLCRECQRWHIGHLPRAVIAGLIGADALYALRDRRRRPEQRSITCPRCGATSYNPNDITERYCGACHWWTSDPVLGAPEVIAQAEHDGALQPVTDHHDYYYAKGNRR